MSFTRRMREAQQQASRLPEPGVEALAHSNALRQHIATTIAAAGGRITFQAFMELALYAPGLGYYSAGSQKLGREGDFVTAPEISSLFSRCLARAIEPVLNNLTDAQILEVGAGSGVMAAGIMDELSTQMAKLPSYLILERSADLIERQQQTVKTTIPQLENSFTWLQQIPDKFNGVVLGNELLDAIPVQRVIFLHGHWQELYVALDGNAFIWQAAELSDARLLERLNEIQQRVGELPEGYTTEVNLAAEDWLRSLLGALQHAVVLLIDYGQPRNVYYHPQRVDGTLLCHYRHRAHDDVFAFLGLQDITAHIDFTAMADVALECACKVSGYTTQAQFLIASGLSDLLAETGSPDVAQHLELASQVKRLTLPQEMGETFKVIAINKNTELRVKGFELRDMREQL